MSLLQGFILLECFCDCVIWALDSVIKSFLYPIHALACECGFKNNIPTGKEVGEAMVIRDFLSFTTLTLAAIGACTLLLAGDALAFTSGVSRGPQLPPHVSGASSLAGSSLPFVSAQEVMGAKGVVCFGMGFGILMALSRGLSQSRVSCKASFEQPGSLVVKEKDTDISKIAYLQDVPRTIIEKDTLEKLLKVTPRDQWEDPPEDTYLYTLKTFAEVYGPGKATKMGWWDYFRLKVDLPDTAELQDEEDALYVSEYYRLMMEGKVPFAVPGPAGYWYTGAIIQWKGKEPFAGDQVQTLLENGRWSKQFLSNLAFYREGLKPWQRGLEIGMAHGYFLIGPFTSLGPLRNTPEAATVGLLCDCGHCFRGRLDLRQHHQANPFRQARRQARSRLH